VAAILPRRETSKYYSARVMHVHLLKIIIVPIPLGDLRAVNNIKDLNTQWKVPGWLFFDIEYDHVISCMGWNYVNTQLFDEETINVGRSIIIDLYIM